MKLPGAVADFLPAPLDDAVDALAPLEALEPAAEEGVWPQGADEGSGWWWNPEQAASYPAQWAVLDTNQVLDHLEAVQCIVAQMTGMNCVVPRVVLKELELLQRLEDTHSLTSGAGQAEEALRFLRSQLLAFGGFRCSCAAGRSALVLQGETEALHEGLLGKAEGMPSETDGHVLACVRYFAEVVAPDMTELLTSSRSLAIKAAFHGVPSENVLMLMSRGVVSSASVGRPVAEADPPGLGMSALMVMAAEHTAESYAKALADSDDGNEEDKAGRATADELASPSFQDPPGLSQDESATGGSYLRAALRNPPGLRAAKAGNPAKRGYAPSTRSPSSEDGCGEFSTEVSSSPDGFTLESPLGPVPIVSPPWHRLPDVEFCEEEDEEEDDVDEEDNDKSDRASRRAAGGKGTGGERGRKARAAMDATSVVLRGLPFNVTEEEVLAFIRKAGVSREDLAPEGVVALLANAQGRPSGFAEVRLARGVDFWDVRVRLHMQHLRGRYIEALPPRPARKSAAKHGGGRQTGRNA